MSKVLAKIIFASEYHQKDILARSRQESHRDGLKAVLSGNRQLFFEFYWYPQEDDFLYLAKPEVGKAVPIKPGKEKQTILQEF